MDDHTQALPDDVLASILRRLSPRDVAASRGVRKGWLAVVDTRQLVRPHLFPRSVSGLCLNYIDRDRSHLFSRPSARPAIYRHGNEFLYHCNGLLLCRAMGRAPYVVNPATRRWEAIPWKDPKDANPHLVFDPAASPHYEVFLIPHGPKEVVLSSPAHQRLDKSVNLRQFAIQSKGNKHGRPDLMEWPPSLWTLNVFSSRTREWQTRPFVREGQAAGTTTDVLLDPLDPISICLGGPRWRYMDDDDDDDDDDEVESVEVEVKVEEQEDEDDDKVGYGVQQENNETVTSEVCEWNSDDDNVLNIEDYDLCYNEISFLGFHPYKEVVFLGSTQLVAVAYHLKSSKVQYLGEMRPRDYHRSPTNGIYEAFPYTPCMIGELLEHD
ncbi:hypothetical protein ACQ4PT_065176 [Festuca glaucescens]